MNLKKLQTILPVCCFIVSLLLLIFAAAVLPAILKTSIESTIAMSPDKYQYWGQNPGKTKSVTKRNFTFTQFTNPRGFLYRNEQPIFKQKSGYLFQQKSNFTDYNYTQDMTEVKFNYWLFFTEMQGSRDIDQKVSVINVAPLGFWHQLNLVNISKFALQGFGGLFVQLNNTIKTQAIGQGIAGQYLTTNDSWIFACSNNQIPIDQCMFSWSDPQNGLSDQNNYQAWVNAFYYEDLSSQDYIQEYFGFTNSQMNNLKGLFQQWSDSINTILNNWYCNGQQCSGNHLALVQLSTGQITADPPIGDAVSSICETGNVTCIGQPQISTFLHGEFKNKISDDPIYQSLTFTTQNFKVLFQAYKGTLLNIGSLNKMFYYGQQYDKLKPENATQADVYLQKIQILTKSQSKNHAFVVWEWVKYMTYEFVIKSSKKGTRHNAGIGGVASQAIYQSFNQFGQWILNEYISILSYQAIKDCQQFVLDIIPSIDQVKAIKICKDVNAKNYTKYYPLIEPCFGVTQKRQAFQNIYGLTSIQMAEYCDQQQKSFFTVGEAAHLTIFNQYQCNPIKGLKHCSAYQLALKQFISSKITKNPIVNSVKEYQVTLTGKAWNKELQQFQYVNYLKEYYGDQMIDPYYEKYTTSQLIDLFSFDKLFSAPMIMELMLNEDQKSFQQLYYWKNMTFLKNYIRFVTIQIGFGGFTQKRSMREVLFGYQDPFLKTLKQTDTMLGGDPSINPVIMLNEPNITREQAYQFPQSMYTGYSHPEMTRQYSSVSGKRFIAYNQTYYDGQNIQSQFVNPYKQIVPLKGTDAIQNPPNLTPNDKVYVYIPSLYRYGQLVCDYETSKYGFDLLHFVISDNFIGSEEQFPQNQKYYQTFQGFVNVSFLGPPLFIGKNHFYSATANWSKLVTVLDQKGQKEITASLYDETQLKIQPMTGALFRADLNLQTNYYYSQDSLFIGGKTSMLPIFYVRRSGQIEESTVNQLLGPLRFALILKTVLIVVSSVFMATCVGAFVFFRIKKAKGKKDQSLLQKSIQSQSSSKIGSVASNQQTSNINRTIIGTFKQ